MGKWFKRSAWLAGSFIAAMGGLYAVAWWSSEQALAKVYEIRDPSLAFAGDAVEAARGAHLYGVLGCVECHGAKKVKGKLRMDSLEALKKGGSEGAAFVAGDLQKSLMHVRVTLDPSDEEFMPTEGNPLTKDQVQAFALFIEGKPIPDDVAKAAIAAPDTTRHIADIHTTAAALKLQGTPTFFVNGKPLSSTDPDQLFELVKREVERLR